MGGLVASQAIGWSGMRAVVILQALTPFVLGPALPIAIAAFATGHWVLGVVSTAIVGALAVLARPLLTPPPQPPQASDDGLPVSIFHANLLFKNRRLRELPELIGAVGADVLAFTEFTNAHAAMFAGSPLADRYPHRVEHPMGDTGGSAIWSRHPLTQVDVPESRDKSTGAIVHASAAIRVYAVHPPSPMMSLGGWLGELETLRRELDPDADEPMIVVGDFNASYWHPPFRRLLRAGWRSAHHVAGAAFSASWRADKRPLPPFVRLDHALVNDRVVVTAVRDIDVPGSDHRGFVASIAPAAAATRDGVSATAGA
jgi:endonuclease/exonuclease/phosphatase (EEP) superfamily protein YafD